MGDMDCPDINQTEIGIGNPDPFARCFAISLANWLTAMRVAGPLPSNNAGTGYGFASIYLRNLVLLVLERPQGINIATTLNLTVDMHIIRRKKPKHYA
jgi:hypothetical protein